MPHGMNDGLEQFSFVELWSPFLFAILIVIALLYSYAIKKMKNRLPEAERVPVHKKVMFFSGLLLFYIAEGSPLNLIGHHYLFSVHMINMALAYITMPPLILGGLPAWLISPFFQKPLIDKLVRFVTNPFLAILLFNGLFSLYHFPLVFDWVMSSSLYMAISNYILLITAFIMWWPTANPLPEYNRLSFLQKLGYMFANSVLITPACALIMFSNTILFDTYTNAYQLIEWLTPLYDQSAGGVIMKIIQEIVYGSMLGVIFFQWVRKEKKDEPSHNPKSTALRLGDEYNKFET